MSELLQRATVAFGLLALCACGHTTNQALCDTAPCSYDPDTGYRFDPRKAQHRETFIVLTFSGGGIRAAALAYGTLKALQDLPGINAGDNLLDEVDVISSVSGGSVTAAWYALKGQAGLSPEAGDEANELLKFLHNDSAMVNLSWRGLNPVTLGRYAFTRYQRSDVLADYFSNRLFYLSDAQRDATYADVARIYRTSDKQPFVILNATDLGHATRFPFTQNRFDLICSDLDRYKLAYAVAASANFPIVFSPIGIKNYSRDCPAHGDAAWADRGPPHWMDAYAKFDASDPPAAGVPTPRSDALFEVRLAREASGYVRPKINDDFLHLVDGGVVDNLGIQSTLALDDEAECAPGAFQRLKKPRPPAYERVREVLYIVVNARSRSPAGIDEWQSPPDVFSTFKRVIETPIDNSILGTQNYLTAELHVMEAQESGYHPPGISTHQSCWSQRAGTASTVSQPALNAQTPVKTRIVTVDFELIPHPPCREKFWEMGTTWTLDDAAIDDLVALPRVLLRRSGEAGTAGRGGELADFYRDMGRPPPQFADTRSPKTFASVCAARSDP